MPSSSLLSDLHHRHVDSSVSTNSELIERIQDGTLAAHTPHLLTAETQSAGRGQRTRSWQSPRGNVYLSLYHPVQVPVSGLLSLVIGVELAKMPVIQALNEQLQAQNLTPIGVKWANDLGFYNKHYPSDEQASHCSNENNSNAVHSTTADVNNPQIIYFSKLAGILIEPVWRTGKLIGVVMGVGLNVKATPKLTTQTCEGMSYQALSLQDIYNSLKPEKNNDQLTSVPSLADLYEQISQALIAAMICFEQLVTEKLTSQTLDSQTDATDHFMQQFDALDALAGLRLRVTQNHNGEPQMITGQACGIDTHGCLQLRQDNGKLCALFTGRIDVIN